MVKLLCLLAWVLFHFGQVHSCSISSAAISAVFKRPDDIWLIRLGWSSDNPDCTLKLEEQVSGQAAFKDMDRQMCTSGRYCYFKTSTQSCDDGKPQYSLMKFTSMCSRCQFATFTFTIGGLVNSKGASTTCSRIIYPGKTSPRTASHLKFSECGQNRTCTKVGQNVGPGCYCDDGYVLNATTGLCEDQSVCPPKRNPKIPLNLKTPGCVKLGESVEVSWEVNAERMYKYNISSYGVVRKSETLAGKTDPSKAFNVVGKIGTLTIPSTGLGPGQYSFEVEDINSDEKNNETGNFNIKAGCKPVVNLEIDASGICAGGESTGRISWSVQADRTYKYTVSGGGKVVQVATVPGSGSASFPVSNGRGQVTLKLEPGDYTVTVQDLDAGVDTFYSEFKDFSVAACGLEIRTNTCVESGQNVEFTLNATAGRTYRYAILVAGRTSQVVKSGSVGASLGGNKYVLASTNTLPVGRYILMITEVETGGEGYDSFLVTASGDIGSEVRYTANGGHSGMYICLQPFQGGSFAGGLTAKVGSAAEATLTGQVKCHLQPYTGSESTLTISVRKNGGTADQVAIRYRG